jgi:hypothetical protein
MREPQVDRFCRCVKKVKKTLKAEGRAIAICTKSVLQTKGRTLRKVRCRDKVLETQPMKPQEGGKFRWMGADTPVFNNENVNGWNGFPVMWVDVGKDRAKAEAQLKGWIDKYDPVVRMVSSGDGEIAIHRTLKDMIDRKTPPFNDPFVTMHINLWASDGIYRVDYLKTEEKVRTQGTDAAEKLEKLKKINSRFTRVAAGRGFKWYGLVTRTQLKDVGNMNKVEQIAPLCDILRTLLHIDGYVVHFDLHHKNMAVMRDGTAVIHDVGRMKLRDFETAAAPWELVRPTTTNKRILRNALRNIFEYPNYYMDYWQHFYIGRAFMDLRKDGNFGFVKEAYPVRKEEDGWIQMPVNMSDPKNKGPFDTNAKRFETWLDEFNKDAPTGATSTRVSSLRGIAGGLVGTTMTKVYGEDGTVVVLSTKKDDDNVYLDNPFETRYYQIARIFDILSVLATLSHTGGTGRVAFHHARKTAVSLIGLVNATPPDATRAKVEEVVRAFLKRSGTINRNIANDIASETAAGLAYWKEVNEPRSGKKAAPAVVPEAEDAERAEFMAALEDAELAQDFPTPEALREVDADAKAAAAASKRKDESPPLEDKEAAAAIMSPQDVMNETAAAALALPPGIQRARMSPESLLEEDVNPVATVPTKGGVFKAAGYTAITFEAGPGQGWRFLPPPVAGAVLPSTDGLDPANYVAYVSNDPDIVAKHDAIRDAASGTDSPIGRIINTYVGHYECDLVAMGEADKVGWILEDGRLIRHDRHFPSELTRDQDATVENLFESDQVVCLIIPKFKTTLEDLPATEKRNALFEILDGLVELDGAVVINDLHTGNMAVMPDGHAVTFDYDRMTNGSEEFKSMVMKILENTSIYEGFPQYKHIVDLENDVDREAKIPKLEKISDILAVLAAVEDIDPTKQTAIKVCRVALWNSNTKDERQRAIDTLKTVLIPPARGGRHTFKRRGLPRLL